MGEVVYRCRTKATDREGEQIRRSFHWLFARRGELRLTERAIECGNWTILYADIDDAVLVAIPTKLGTGHIVRVKSRGKTYQFQLKSISLWWIVTDPYWMGETPLHLRREVSYAGQTESEAQYRRLLFLASFYLLMAWAFASSSAVGTNNVWNVGKMTAIQRMIPVLMRAYLGSQVPKPSGEVDPPLAQDPLAIIAGEYFRGDGFVGRTLKVDPGGRYSFAWGADDGGYHRQEGTATFVDGSLSLQPLKSESNRKGAFAQPNYRPIRWDKRLYLLTESECLPFCNAVNLGLEPRLGMYGRFYLRMQIPEKVRKGDADIELEKPEGLPGVAKPRQPFLLSRPLEGRVIEVLPDKRARISLGSNDGLRLDFRTSGHG